MGKTADAADFRSLAANIRKSFIAKFANADGSFADGSLTGAAAALYFRFIEGAEAEKSIKFLVEQVRQQEHKANFGILGSKYIPRVLADYGYADDAFEIITQKEFPGWGWTVAQGATTLWENWNGKGSQNHIMFGDISAWMYKYLGGIKPQEATPGFSKFVIEPCFVQKLDWIKASYQSPYGVIQSSWQRKEGKIECSFAIPAGSSADIILPGKKLSNVSGMVKETF